MSIPDLLLKIKRKQGIAQLLKIGLFIALSSLFFVLGRLSIPLPTETINPIKIHYPPLVTPQLTQESSSDWAAIASKSGSVYYLPNCTGFNRIKEENRVYFKEESEAVTAGYSLSSTCKP